MKPEPLMRAAVWLLRVIGLLPLALVRTIGSSFGSLAYLLVGSRRRVTLINLRKCFPEWSEARRRKLARAHFRCLAASLFERFIVWYTTPDRVRRLVKLLGSEHLLPWRGRPVILLAPHFVGIDAGGVRLLLDVPLASMYANQKSRVLTEVMTRGRVRLGDGKVLLRNHGLRPALRLIRQGVPFYFLPDMDLGARDALFVPFFGVPAATVPSLARLAQLTNAVVIPVVTRMTAGGYVAQIYPAWTDFPEDDLLIATRRMNEFIEQRVLEMPEQYLWSHRRFKTRPPGEPDAYS
ncbi:MAG: lipid A biosynthesis acyltransferase [Quisquiliibacterium sp.]